MPSLTLRKPFRYRRQKHQAGAVLDVDPRDVKLLTGLGIVEKPGSTRPTPRPTPPTPSPSPTPPTPPRVFVPGPVTVASFEGRTDPPKRTRKRADEDA